MENVDIHIQPHTAENGRTCLRIEDAAGEFVAVVGRVHGVDAELPYAMDDLARHIAAVCLGWSFEDDEEGSA